MPLTDAHWRFLAEEVLDVRPEHCVAIVRGIEARHPDESRARALGRSFLARTTLAGVAPGTTDARWRGVALSILEARAVVRQRALFRACLGVLDDPRFFERDDWARRALGLDETGAAQIAAAIVRASLRFAIVRTARRATRWIGPGMASIAGASTGALFNTIEQAAFVTALLAKHERAHRRAAERAQNVIALVPRSRRTAGNENRTTKGRGP